MNRDWGYAGAPPQQVMPPLGFLKNLIMVSELGYLDGIGGDLVNNSVLVIDTAGPVS